MDLALSLDSSQAVQVFVTGIFEGRFSLSYSENASLKLITVIFPLIPGFSVFLFCCKHFSISCQNSNLL